MKVDVAKKVREQFTQELMAHFAAVGEDVGQITSGSFNFPVAVDGQEGWVEIVVKIPKDDGDDGFLKRDEFKMAQAEKAAKAEQRAKDKAAKIARDEKARAEKKARAQK
jgi:hypothetical protein